ncbi:MAG: hypothetical protein JOY94_03685 [Methylobacteriaceae bacterium]|nr:hypothetical protein [Methylobacteriaceae bacterium]
MRRAFLAAALFFITVVPAFAEVRILSSPGGEVGTYLKLFSILRESGQRIIIDGPCLSACTLVLSAIPRDQICVTSRAVLGFHAPRLVDEDGSESAAAEATRLMAATYPAPVRAWIRRHGGLTSKTIFLSGRQLAALYPHCS